MDKSAAPLRISPSFIFSFRQTRAHGRTTSHPIYTYPEEARIAYVSLLGDLCYVDRQFDEQERKLLEQQMNQLDIQTKAKLASMQPSMT